MMHVSELKLQASLSETEEIWAANGNLAAGQHVHSGLNLLVPLSHNKTAGVSTALSNV